MYEKSSLPWPRKGAYCVGYLDTCLLITGFRGPGGQGSTIYTLEDVRAKPQEM